ncbi:NAD(P)/FAD-dependent oxidoreductase [Roseovarius nitratireducens]|uniref:NAD(P)/FAD-dependent oxidoreductase n=1 Tax=Roseovarius nitratireducens TaxID=2044597 RepID=UPI000CE21FD3|nr:FAD-binding oxidoreductase [Roseovarius nitratireducens]
MTKPSADRQPTLAELAGKAAPPQGGVPAALCCEPYWRQIPDASGGERLPQPEKVDVAVIGSGFTGLSAALTLVRAGRSVAVLEKDQLGAGASTRNGSQLGSGNQKFHVKTLIEMFGELKAKALLLEGVAMLDYIEELIRVEKLDCHFGRCGRFRGAVRPAHYDAMARDMEDLRKHAGVESFMVPKEDQHKEIYTDFFHGGSVLPDDASLHPGLYHHALVTRLRDSGAVLLEETPALGIEADGREFVVSTPAGPIRAANVIAATNGYTRGFDRYLSRRIVQVPSSVIVTETVPQQTIDALMPAKRMYGNSARVFFYFRAAPSEPRLIWGGRVGRMVRANTPHAFGHLAADMLRVFPDLGAVKATHGWTGQIGYTFDELPHLGKTPKGIHFAMGYCGTGVTRSTYFGHKIALKVLGDPKGRTEFDDITFPTHPFHFVADRAVPVVESWYRVKDSYT